MLVQSHKISEKFKPKKQNPPLLLRMGKIAMKKKNYH